MDRNAAIDEISRWAMSNGGVRVMGPLGFENAYAFAMREQRARELDVVDISSLSRHAPDLSLGSDLEFLERPEWRSVRDAYTLQFGKARSFAPSLMYDALASGEVDVISAFSSDGRIDAGHLVVLSDPRRALPGYDALLLISNRVSGDKKILDALGPLIGAITVENMRHANYSVDRAQIKQSPQHAAKSLAARLKLPN